MPELNIILVKGIHEALSLLVIWAMKENLTCALFINQNNSYVDVVQSHYTVVAMFYQHGR